MGISCAILCTAINHTHKLTGIILSPFQGKMAIHSPSTGIVDWGRVTRAYGEDFKEMGGHIYTDFKVTPPALP